MEPKDRILQAARELFFQYGIKSITMDDMAKHLGMSKKTIYQYVSDKDELVGLFTQKSLESNQCGFEDATKDSKDAIEEMMRMMQYMTAMFSQLNPNLFYDLQKYHPKAWNKFREFKETTIMGVIEGNLKRGIGEGVYRKDLDTAIIAKYRIEQVELAMNPIAFPPNKYNLTQVQVVMLDHFMHGITTIKGHKLINQYKHIKEDE